MESHSHLDGLRVLLSGSIPDRQDWTEPGLDRAILEFARDLTALVLKHGGRMVHGCHPSLTPVLLAQARRFLRPEAASERLTLVMSQLWARSAPPEQLAELQRHSLFVVTPSVGDGDARDAMTRNLSLTVLRKALVDHADVVVAVGGRMHRGRFTDGIEEELDLARAQGLPCFLIGALGGKTEELASTRLADLSRGNGLTNVEREQFAATQDVAGLAGQLVRHLAAHGDHWPRRAVRVFCSCASADRPRAEPIARRLREAGIDAWLDVWSDDDLDKGVFGTLQEQAARCDVALPFWSTHARSSRRLHRDADSFAYAGVQDGKRVVVVRLDRDPPIPESLRTAPTFAPEQLDDLIELLRRPHAQPSSKILSENPPIPSPDPNAPLSAADGIRLFEILNQELRQMARRIGAGEAGLTLQPTALVNEVYLKMFGGRPRSWNDQVHFMRSAATTMRRILLDHKRQLRNRKERGERADPLDEVLVRMESRCGGDLMSVNEALEDLAREDAAIADYVTLRFFGGRTNAETTRILGIDERTGKHHWHFARAWLMKRLGP